MQRNYQKQNKEMKKKPFRLLNYIWSDNDQILFPCVYIYIYITNKKGIIWFAPLHFLFSSLS